MGRRFVMVDSNREAVEVMYRRLGSQGIRYLDETGAALPSYPHDSGMARAGAGPDAGRMTSERHDHTTRCWWNHHEARWVCRPAAADLPEPGHPGGSERG